MRNATGLAALGAFALLPLGCERQERLVAPNAGALFTTATALTSVVTDAAGDLDNALPPVARQPYHDVVGAEIRLEDGTFILSMEMAAGVPDAPELAPPGYKLLVWAWRLNSNLQTFPAGFPFVPGIPKPAEYLVWVFWDGTSFGAQLIDRTPLLAGENATVTPLSFDITGATLTAFVESNQIANPAGFRWSVETQNWQSPLGTEAWQFLDHAPNLADGEPPAIWPS